MVASDSNHMFWTIAKKIRTERKINACFPRLHWINRINYYERSYIRYAPAELLVWMNWKYLVLSFFTLSIFYWVVFYKVKKALAEFGEGTKFKFRIN